MHKNLLYLLIVCSVICKAQTFLTNAQVYNFDIGDVMQARFEKPWVSTDIYETKTILNKTISAGNDSIVYTIQEDMYTVVGGSTPSSSFSTSVVTQTVTNLLSNAQHQNQTSSCMGPLKDTVYLDYCGQTVWKKYDQPSISCSSTPDIQKTYLVAGLGGPYYEYTLCMFCMSKPAIKYTLLYYSKLSGSCGTYITTAKEHVMPLSNLLVYPNPTDKLLSIKSDVAHKRYDVINYLGQTAQSGISGKQMIDVSELAAGNYMLILYTVDGKTLRQKFVKE